MLSKAIRRYKANELTHLVVELKAPKVKIDEKEILQVEQYAISVTKDERFKNVKTTWAFWAISDDYGDYAEYRMKNGGGENGKIHEADNLTIWVKTWAQVIDENRARMQFFQEKLEYEAKKSESLQDFQKRYAEFLQGIIAEEVGDDPPNAVSEMVEAPPVRRKKKTG